MKHLLQGKLTISRIQNNPEPHDLMRIELHDVNSGVLVTSVEISMYDFAMAITGLARVPCEFDFHPEHAGKVMEQKIERISFGKQGTITYNMVHESAKPYEVDGWVCSLEKSQRINQDGVSYVNVPFKRYVEQKEGEQS